MPRLLVMGLAAAVVFSGAAGRAAEAVSLFENFSPGWRTLWREQGVFTRPTIYDVVIDSGRPVLHAVSRSTNSGLIREQKLSEPAEIRLRWRWKVRRAIEGNTLERERAGDDYAARVFLVFETSVNPLRTRAINYVWASAEKPGAIYASPYAKNVAIIVLRSGDGEAGTWCEETRDVLADYRAYFGEPPMKLNAVAVSVDTDNTKSEAEAWFSDLRLETSPRAGDATPP